MKEYLIKNYDKRKNDKNAECTILILSEREIFKYIQNAKEKDMWIAIFEIGDCLLDWS